MPTITLPDGSERQFDHPVTVAEVAASIGSGLAKATLAGQVDDQLVDAGTSIDKDAKLRIITSKDPEGLEIIRHSTAHLLAQAVKQLYPEAQITIGPVIEDGFYYDIAFERPFTPEDLEKIEKRMAELAKAEHSLERQELSRDEAIALFEGMGEHYKVQIIKDLPEGEVLTAYKQGDFIDLCRGPHVPNTSHLQAFKLTKLAGAYWRGDSNNEMLQRIYGTAWPNKKELKAYLARIEEAKKRDHREIAKKMDLYHIQPEAPGQIFWHPNGWSVIKAMREYLRMRQREAGYQEINTPLMVDESLWEQSGHKAKFGDDMFTCETDDRNFLIKPMSCPCHVQVFKQGIKSYRELPIRFSEFGHCHRNEPSGTLHGLLRVRGMVQDDGHVFCTQDMIHSEVVAFIDQLHTVYRDMGLTDLSYKLATRPQKRVGSDEVWEKSEQALAAALTEKVEGWEMAPGEGAFYGPKIEFHVRDCLGRTWQLGTMQVDFSMPERLGATYIAEDGSKQTPVMLHRAILGSFERFLGILLEHYAGRLPVWLAPNQVVTMGVADRHNARVSEITNILQKMGFRAISDLRNEKIGFKIREHTISRVPFQIVIGDREVENGSLAVRASEDKESRTMTVEEFAGFIRNECEFKD
jgi:threonyl-tRNA synthetase